MQVSQTSDTFIYPLKKNDTWEKSFEVVEAEFGKFIKAFNYDYNIKDLQEKHKFIKSEIENIKQYNARLQKKIEHSQSSWCCGKRLIILTGVGIAQAGISIASNAYSTFGEESYSRIATFVLSTCSIILGVVLDSSDRCITYREEKMSKQSSEIDEAILRAKQYKKVLKRFTELVQKNPDLDLDEHVKTSLHEYDKLPNKFKHEDLPSEIISIAISKLSPQDEIKQKIGDIEKNLPTVLSKEYAPKEEITEISSDLGEKNGSLTLESNQSNVQQLIEKVSHRFRREVKFLKTASSKYLSISNSQITTPIEVLIEK